MSRGIAIIVDIVGSRDLSDRESAQRHVEETFRRTEERHPPARPLWATAGDEFQAVYAEVTTAIDATALVRLLLPDGVDVRFGLGDGEYREISEGGRIQDGSAWWNAREAIVTAERREKTGEPFLRTWFDDGERGEHARLVNAFLVTRDHVITRMKARERRVAASALLGEAQASIAASERVTQSAVSQSLRRSGGSALLSAQELLTGGAR